MKVYLKCLIILILVVIVSSSLTYAQKPDPDLILENVRNTFNAIDDYTVDASISVDVDFLRVPGTGTTRTSIHINDRELCVGMVAFPVRGGIQPGRWRLVIELEESKIEVPFNLGM